MLKFLIINWNMDAAMKNGFPHFMLKEIHEQPEALRNTILPRLSKGLPDFTDDQIPDDVFTSCSQIHIVAFGTAMHAGMAARSMMEPLLRIPVTVSVASEFRYEEPLIADIQISGFDTVFLRGNVQGDVGAVFKRVLFLGKSRS